MAEIVGGEPVLWRTFGTRVVHDGPEVCLTEVDVGLPTRERVWLPVVRLPRSVAVVLLDGLGGVLLVRRYGPWMGGGAGSCLAARSMMTRKTVKLLLGNWRSRLAIRLASLSL